MFGCVIVFRQLHFHIFSVQLCIGILYVLYVFKIQNSMMNLGLLHTHVKVKI
jgi:hypothetical protein